MRYRESEREIERWRKEIGRERKRKERREAGERKERYEVYACIGFHIVQTADLHVFDVLGEISALDHLGLVTDPLFRGFVQLLVVVQ